MIYCAFYNTVEFYIICAFVAAAVIAAVASPARRGPVRTFLYAGELIAAAQPGAAGIEARVDDHARLLITRYGLNGISETGAYSLAVEIAGFDVTIRERLTPGKGSIECPAATCTIDCLGREHYHFTYISEVTHSSAAFALNIRPGNTVLRPLQA